MAESVSDIIKRLAGQYGMPVDHMLKVAQLESGMGKQPGNGGGIYQFEKPTWGQYGKGLDITDPQANVDAGMRFHKDVHDQMAKALGREPTPQELYLGAMHGPSGAIALIQNPGQLAVQTLSPFYKSNDDPNGTLGATGALKGNNQTTNMSGTDVINHAANYYDTGAQGSTQTAAATPQPTGGILAAQPDADLAGYGSPAQGSDTLAGQADEAKMWEKIMGAAGQFTKAGVDAYGSASKPRQQPQIQAPEAHIPQAQAPGNPDFITMLRDRLQSQGTPQSPLDQLLAQKRLMGGM